MTESERTDAAADGAVGKGRRRRAPFVKGGCAADREVQSKGGKACAKARLLRRTMREWALAFRDAPAKSRDDPTLTMGGEVVRRMYANANEGDVRAAEFLAKLQGEMVERVETAEVPKLVDDI